MKPTDTIGGLVGLASRVLTNELEAQFSQNGLKLTREQWIFLMTVIEAERITPLELSQRLLKNRGSVTSLIKGLEKRELIRRLTSETDGRSYSIVATPEAIALVESSKHVAFGVLGKALHNFDDQQQQQLHELLNMFVENLLGENNG
ncbi:MarR family winged helix-turn-helix transcriptional regulator [Vibrio europaeus]|uniref:MarR family winged helix-turn-helix transcriptional regulator n=1 Tax=Vibrio europaeus TaxID=300876 RepID=UPI0020A2F47B|nr:MarR family transcriptional regulator [Vibrio europaeus]MDC5820599.1 MarR family transcriptional regulator [Vibrio europaeus]MDC5841972.1 MarR family transcriptional regulator [Vibrio europaeus]MDC5855326.1 MarR family transcriptional regulator [Vibrio europaeus]MDC5870731.1 MarR family transcriptional regulator [Vibrio europaeus]